ncbi:hypothetical protein FXO37_35236 [Capsicum annuum]|nr:hypothetical protein FXO37_35236 [Capsicum annuum]
MNFTQSTNGVDKKALVERFLKENFENKEDAHQMAILYFIHTFINSQLDASPVPFSDFKMVEDGKYQFFSWGKVSFSRLMALLRQEFSMEKQLYRLSGIPRVLNVWMFELCSNVDAKVTVKEENNIPLVYANIIPTADEFEKLDLLRTSFASDHHDTEEKSKVDADSTFTLNRKELLVKADLYLLKSKMKTYVKTYIDKKFKDLERVMNDRFTEVLKSLQQKNETVKQETILKQSRQECDPSDDVVDDAGPTSTDGVVKENDKSDVGIEKQSDIVVEEMQSLESIIPGREHDLTLMIYKRPPTTPAEYTTTDWFFKVYIDKAYVNYYNSDVAKDLATQDASARTDEVADMEMSLINTIKGLSTRASQPWHMVNEVFVPINCDGVFHWVLTVIALKDRCIRVYDSVAFSRKRKQTSEIEKLAVMIPTYLQYSNFMSRRYPLTGLH